MDFSDPLDDFEEAEELLAGSEDQDEIAKARARRAEAEAWSAGQAFVALADVAASVASNLDLESLVREILDIALDSLGAERGIVFLGNGGGDQLVPAVARSLHGGDLEEVERVSRTILSAGLAGQSVFSPDAQVDPRFADVPSVRLSEVRGVFCVPMLARGEAMGVIYADSPRDQRFPEHAKRFVGAFAGLAAVAVQNAQLHGAVRRENVRLKRRAQTADDFGRILTVNNAMRALIDRAAMASPVDAPVMLLGESGTGKELLARAIHESGPRALQPFVAYNCAAVPSELAESIFFGHVKGAFSGANRDTPGLFRQAHKGVLFLDEIADLKKALQAKLLRVLEDGRVRPVGADREHEVDIRLVVATSRHMADAVRAGEFREDLYYRINVLELVVPPLRERPEDIPLLLDHFVAKHAVAERTIAFTDTCIDFLTSLPWRGNVRELENFVRRALVMTQAAEVSADRAKHLLSSLSMQSTHQESVTEAAPAAQTPAANSQTPAPRHGGDILSLENQERQAILSALERAGGNKSKAARILGIHRNSLLRRMARLGVDWKDPY